MIANVASPKCDIVRPEFMPMGMHVAATEVIVIECFGHKFRHGSSVTPLRKATRRFTHDVSADKTL